MNSQEHRLREYFNKIHSHINMGLVHNQGDQHHQIREPDTEDLNDGNII